MKFPYEAKVAGASGFTILKATGAHYTCPEGTHITMTLKVSGGLFGEGSEIPFTAVESDHEAHSRELFEHFKSKAKKYVKPAPTVFELQSEFDELMTDITLGLATDEEIARAKELRVQLKEMR